MHPAEVVSTRHRPATDPNDGRWMGGGLNTITAVGTDAGSIIGAGRDSLARRDRTARRIRSPAHRARQRGHAEVGGCSAPDPGGLWTSADDGAAILRIGLPDDSVRSWSKGQYDQLVQITPRAIRIDGDTVVAAAGGGRHTLRRRHSVPPA